MRTETEYAINKLLNEAEELSDNDILYKSFQIYKEVLEIDEENITALICISDCLIQMKMEKEASIYAEKAYILRKGSDDDMATVNYSCILIGTKEYEKAIDILEEEKANNSENYLVFNNLGWTYFLSKQYVKALDNYNISILLEERNGLAYCNRGRLKYFTFNDQDGIDDLNKAYQYGDYEAGIILQSVLQDKRFLS